MRLACWLLCLAASVSGHAILEAIGTNQYPQRPGISGGTAGVGTKLTPFAQAASIANNGCGGPLNSDPGVQQPTLAFSPGDSIQLSWKMTIPHPADAAATPQGTGVRIAVHYTPGDSFQQNILAGGILGDPGVGTLDVDPQGDAERDEIITSPTVTLPNKPCDYCTLQWIWAAENDGGSYVACVDISITDNGQLPDFANIPSEVGNILPGVPPSPLPPGASAPPPAPGTAAGATGNQGTDGGGGNAAGPVIGVIVGLAAVGGFVYWFKKVRGKAAGPGAPPPKATNTAVAVPPPPPGPPSDLPPGWQEAKDPATGVTYYFNPSTGETQWTKPNKV